MNIKVGDTFPDFILQNQDGKNIDSTEFNSKWIVIYFYPKDDTRGCTVQAKSFTQIKEEFNSNDIKVIGVSQDSVASHKDFCDKFSLSIDLVSDPKCELINAVGLPQLEWEGVKYWGRTTVILDSENVVRKIYEDVTPEEHHTVIIDDIKKMS